jgi:hypothetical protein
LDEVIGRNALGGGHFLHGARDALLVMLTEPEDGAGCIIAFDRKFHDRIADAGCPPKSAALIDSQEDDGHKKIPRVKLGEIVWLREEISRTPLRGRGGLGRLETYMRQIIRAWFEAIETPFLEVVSGQRRGVRVTLARSILFGLSKIYQLLLMMHRGLTRN